MLKAAVRLHRVGYIKNAVKEDLSRRLSFLLRSQGIPFFIFMTHVIGYFLTGCFHLVSRILELMERSGFRLDIWLHVRVDVAPLYRGGPDFFRMQGSPEYRHGAGGFQVLVEAVDIHGRIAQFRVGMEITKP